jgi:chromosome segregation ATPase
MYQNRLKAAKRELNSARNESNRLCGEIRSCDNQMSDYWGQIHKWEYDISEQEGTFDVVKRGEAQFDWIVAERHRKAAIVGEFAGTVRFADAYYKKMRGMLTGAQNAQAVDSIRQVKLAINERLDTLQVKIDEYRAKIRTLEQRVTDLKIRIQGLDYRISDLTVERNWCNSEIDRLNSELRYLRMVPVG